MLQSISRNIFNVKRSTIFTVKQEKSLNYQRACQFYNLFIKQVVIDAIWILKIVLKLSMNASVIYIKLVLMNNRAIPEVMLRTYILKVFKEVNSQQVNQFKNVVREVMIQTLISRKSDFITKAGQQKKRSNLKISSSISQRVEKWEGDVKKRQKREEMDPSNRNF